MIKTKWADVKIVQIVIGPNDSTYQGALFGLGSDGAVYRANNDNRWHEYFPNTFAITGNAESEHLGAANSANNTNSEGVI